MEIGELTTLLRDFTPEQGDERFLELRDLENALRSKLFSTMEAVENWKRNRHGPVTRWDLESDFRRAQLKATRPGAPECLTCGHQFYTDADFWRHYVVPQIEYPNLGGCWTKTAAEYAGTREEWPMDDLGRRTID